MEFKIEPKQDSEEERIRKEQTVKELCESFNGYNDIEVNTLVNKALIKRIDNTLLKDKLINKLQDEVIYLQNLNDIVGLNDYEYSINGKLKEVREL